MTKARSRSRNHRQSFAPLCAILVLGIVAFQSVEVSEVYGRVLATPLWMLSVSLVPALFTIAGFVLGQRTQDARPAAVARQYARRFAPPLAIAVLLSAFVMGPLVTTDRVSNYFADQEVWLFLTNIVGWTHNRLPGVFEFNNAPEFVNEILWTIPYFIAGFAIVLATSKLGKWKMAALGLLLAALSIAAFVQIAIAPFDQRSFLQDVVAGKGLAALCCFLLGVLASSSKRTIPVDWRLALVAGILLLSVAAVGNQQWAQNGLFNLLLAPLLSYLVFYFSLTRLPLSRLSIALSHYLPGFLLFSYPVQQLWIALGSGRQGPVLNLILSVPVAAVLAVVSWHLLQRRILGSDLPSAFSSAAQQDQSQEAAISFRDSWQKRPSFRALRAQVEAVLPAVILGMVLLVVALGVLAILFYALQRDVPGM